jgi:recombinational DNA repair protein (RecF pathway)
VAIEPLALRLLWGLVSALGFAPALESCALDGAPIPAEGPVDFSTGDGGALCPSCARGRAGVIRLTGDNRRDLAALVRGEGELPVLDARHGAAHRRLLARYIRHHLAEGARLPALGFWETREWTAA